MSRRISIWVAVVSIMTVGMTAGMTADAYVPSTAKESGVALRWTKTNCVKIIANSAGSDDITDDSELDAVEAAVSNWNDAVASCSYLNLEALPHSTSVAAGYVQGQSNTNAVIFFERRCASGEKSSDGCWAHDKSASGITTVFYVDDPSSANDGRIVDADIELNGAVYSFATNGSLNATDVENTLTHEIGHLMGLDHPCEDQGRTGDAIPKDDQGNTIPLCQKIHSQDPAEMRALTMYNFAENGETSKRSPAQDDINAVCATYPTAADPMVCGDADGDGGCAIRPTAGETPPANSLWLLLFVLVFPLGSQLGSQLRKRRSDTDKSH
jgi:hypothetical protein